MDSKVGTALMPRAPKHCGINGCTEIVPAGKRCSQHQHRWPTRTGATRTSESGHKAWRAAVLKRDQYQCQLRYDSCIGSATEADHILATAFSGARYDLHNGQAACRPCHRKKSSDEGHAAQGHRQAGGRGRGTLPPPSKPPR